MKQVKYFLSPVFLCVSVLLSAQSTTKQHQPSIRFAIRAGLFSSTFTFEDLPVNQQKPTGDDAFYAGIQFDVPLSNKASVSPEVLYARSSNQTYISRLWFNDLSHLYIPVLFKYKFGKVSILTGPQAEFLLSATGDYLEKAPPTDPNYSYYQKRGSIKGTGYSSFTLSGVAGVEWIFKHRFGIDARYQFGLTNFRSADDPDITPISPSLSDNIKTSGFQAGLIYRFGKNPKRNK
jgi:hypothetical protein